MALYAMKYCSDNQLIPEDYQVRMIIGTDEETLWRGIEYYKRHCDRLPEFSIVVDGDFPAIYAEKGLLDFDLMFKCEGIDVVSKDIKVSSLYGGTGRNVVPSDALCTLKGDGVSEETMIKFFSDENIQWNLSGNRNAVVKSKGISTHAMNPECGLNAISLLIEKLNTLSKEYSTTIDDFLNEYHRLIGLDYNGKKLGLDFEDAYTGKLSFNVGAINLQGNTFSLSCNIRYPASYCYDEVMKVFDNALIESGFDYLEVDHLAPINITQTAPLITALKRAYEKVTKDTGTQMKAIGGATYARALENAVAFGPILPWREDHTHEADEYLGIEDVKTITEIYIKALTEVLKYNDMRGEKW